MIFVSLHRVKFDLGRQIAAGILFLEHGQRGILGIAQVAEAIGIERSNLHKKIKAYGLEEVKPQ